MCICMWMVHYVGLCHCVYVCVCVRACMCVCVYVCVCVCMYNRRTCIRMNESSMSLVKGVE